MVTAVETLADTSVSRTPKPILVLGLTQRVGTNYLGRLLQTHPDCTKPTSLYEDFLVSGLPHLNSFLGTVASGWKEKWGAREKVPELRRLLGTALLEFVHNDTQDAQKRTVLRTPSVEGLEHAADFFHDCDVLVLTRFGPDVVESAMKSFGWTFESACLRWGGAARYVADLMERQQETGRRGFTVIRYEDLVREPEACLRRIFDLVGLDPEGFDFASVSDFPVYGSSAERGGKDKVHWQPVAKSKEFNPLGRSAHWTEDAFRRFDWLTGSVSSRLGYDLPFTYQDRPLSRMLNRLRDQKPRLRQQLHALRAK
jgi:hypothetical protein